MDAAYFGLPKYSVLEKLKERDKFTFRFILTEEGYKCIGEAAAGRPAPLATKLRTLTNQALELGLIGKAKADPQWLQELASSSGYALGDIPGEVYRVTNRGKQYLKEHDI